VKRRYDLEWRARQLAAGHCIVCGLDQDGVGQMCSLCRDRRNARGRAVYAAKKAERLALGIVGPGAGHVNGFAARPFHRGVVSPEDCAKGGRIGGARSGRIRGAKVTAEAMRAARRMLLNVRSDFTPAQVADLERVVAVVYRAGIDRGYARGRQARYAAEKEHAA
jgi:hypothetical protein